MVPSTSGSIFASLLTVRVSFPPAPGTPQAFSCPEVLLMDDDNHLRRGLDGQQGRSRLPGREGNARRGRRSLPKMPCGAYARAMSFPDTPVIALDRSKKETTCHGSRRWAEY